MNIKLISLAAGAALMSASALAMAGDFKYRGGFDDRHERHEQRYNDDDRGHQFSGRRHWTPRNQYHQQPRWNRQWNHHRHDRWCHHGAPRYSYGPHGSSYNHGPGNGSITLILRGDLN